MPQQSRIKQNHLHFRSFSLLCSKHQKRINFDEKIFYVSKLVGYSWCSIPILLKSTLLKEKWQIAGQESLLIENLLENRQTIKIEKCFHLVAQASSKQNIWRKIFIFSVLLYFTVKNKKQKFETGNFLHIFFYFHFCSHIQFSYE